MYKKGVSKSQSGPLLLLQVLEVVAEEEAPLLEYEQLLQQHPSEITQEDRNRQKQFQQDSRSRVASAEAEVNFRSSMAEQYFIFNLSRCRYSCMHL